MEYGNEWMWLVQVWLDDFYWMESVGGVFWLDESVD